MAKKKARKRASSSSKVKKTTRVRPARKTTPRTSTKRTDRRATAGKTAVSTSFWTPHSLRSGKRLKATRIEPTKWP